MVELQVELQLLPVRPEGHLDDDDATTSVLYLAFGAAYIGSTPEVSVKLPVVFGCSHTTLTED